MDLLGATDDNVESILDAIAFALGSAFFFVLSLTVTEYMFVRNYTELHLEKKNTKFVNAFYCNGFYVFLNIG